MDNIGVVASRRKSTAGCKLIRWSDSEITRLHLLYEAGRSRAYIAADLDMTEERIRQRLQYEAKFTTAGIARKKRRMAQREITKDEQKSPRMFFDAVMPGPKPTDRELEERRARQAARPRDLAGSLFGDPPVGFSALEQRA